MIALAGPLDAPLVIGRWRIELAVGSAARAVQPYHTAALMPIDSAETYLRSCRDAAAALAHKALRDVLAELSDYQVRGACVLRASGRPLPGLAGILASHALIHTAEGEFYRAALREACARCAVPETGISERALLAEASHALGCSAEDLQSKVTGFGKVLGSPWRQDEKLSTLAAWLVLARRTNP
jgi:hypothetical protein